MKPIKNHKYLLNYCKWEPSRFLRGTNIITEKEKICYKGIYEYLGNNHFFCNDCGRDIFINNKLFNDVLVEELKK